MARGRLSGGNQARKGRRAPSAMMKASGETAGAVTGSPAGIICGAQPIARASGSRAANWRRRSGGVGSAALFGALGGDGTTQEFSAVQPVALSAMAGRDLKQPPLSRTLRATL